MTYFWSFWIALIIASFSAAEGFALARNKTTLSRYVWNLTKAWPPLPFILGMLSGGLAVHFWWHWCP